MRDGLATTQPGTVRAGRRRIEVVWVMITDVGQRAYWGRGDWSPSQRIETRCTRVSGNVEGFWHFAEGLQDFISKWREIGAGLRCLTIIGTEGYVVLRVA